jgi:hypothetical protein
MLRGGGRRVIPGGKRGLRQPGVNNHIDFSPVKAIQPDDNEELIIDRIMVDRIIFLRRAYEYGDKFTLIFRLNRQGSGLRQDLSLFRNSLTKKRARQ